MTETAWQWAETLGHWLLAWTVVVVVICTWLLVTKVRRAGVRYAGWLLATFAGAAFLPVVLSVSPVVSVPQAVGYVGGDAAFAAERLDEWSEWFGRDRGASRIAATATGLSGEDNRQAGTGRVSFVGLMFAAWTVGLAFYLVRLICAAVRVRRLIAGSNLPVSTELRAQFDATRRELEIGRTIRLAVHPETQTPLCTGIVRPTVVWPAPANDTLCPRERRAAMIHELTHLRRYDDWLRLAGELWRGLCWFYLPVHWTLSRLRREQEYLCDDLAALTLDRPETYAQLLLDHTRVRVPSPILCSSFGGGSAMTSRVRRILRGERRLTPLSRKQTTILIALSAVLLVGAGSLRLVGFVTHARAAEPAAKQTVRGSDQGSDGEDAAVAALKALGARVRLNDNGKVVSVRLGRNRKITDSTLEHIKGLTGLKLLSLGGTRITDAGLEHLRGLKNLVELSLRGTRITDAGLEHLRGLKNLAGLSLRATRVSDAGLVHLKRLTNLKTLNLVGTQVTDAGLEHLKGLRNLSNLDVARSKVTDEGLKKLKQALPNVRVGPIRRRGGNRATGGIRGKATEAEREAVAALEKVGARVRLNDSGEATLAWLALGRLANNPQINDAALEHLKALTKLELLNVSSKNITDAGLVNLKSLTKLQILRLIGTKKITDAGLVHLKPLRNLTNLWLLGTPITDAGLQHLEELRNLEKLLIFNAKITDAGLVHLKSFSNLRALGLGQNKQLADAGLVDLKELHNLQNLNLSGTKVTDAGLEHLKGLTNLRVLDLSDTQITDAGMELLRGLTKLEQLRIHKTKITDAGLVHVKGLTNLQLLFLPDQITDAGMEHLKNLTNVTNLGLKDTQVTDAGLEHLRRLTNLSFFLGLSGTKITDAGLVHLKGLSKLEYVNLTGTKVTSEGAKKLKKALPNCSIHLQAWGRDDS